MGSRNNKYPYIGVYGDKLRVLFTSKSTGIALNSACTHKQGDHRSDWAEDNFIKQKKVK